eukprot:CAMPEP_0115851608 /NCGR_PEP_ID=MMETSP0287-20121206/12570_1 /TAXON_ID=412157 /ORGANISM="Chrysochromulina rotalis, Strain UIO044" /LENGTH=62 /DNA_ID=CAMNT_0003305647 /DNA_START=885 /DNA_END=1073 /DNA_ORIENTATION=-
MARNLSFARRSFCSLIARSVSESPVIHADVFGEESACMLLSLHHELDLDEDMRLMRLTSITE